MQPERALKLLDTLDSLAYAVRLAWAGYGRRAWLLGLLIAAGGLAAYGAAT